MDHPVLITYFANPHQFWFRHPQTRLYSRLDLQFQASINKYCAEQYDAEHVGSDGFYEPDVGEIVAAYDPASKRWTRNRVLGLTNVADRYANRTYQLRSVDEGLPKEADARHVRPLPEKFTDTKPSSAKQGALRNVLPTQNGETPTKEWDKEVNQMIRALIRNAEKTYFTNIICHSIVGEEIQLGDLWVLTKQQKQILVADIILGIGKAVIVDESQFLEHLTLNSPPPQINTPQKEPRNKTPAKLESTSSEPCSVAKPILKQPPNNEPQTSATSALQRLMTPKEYLKLQNELRAPTVDLKALNSASSMAALVQRATNPEPRHQSDQLSPDALHRTGCEAPKEDPTKPPSFLQKKLANCIRRITHDANKTGAITLTAGAPKVAEYPPDTSMAETNVTMLSTTLQNGNCSMSSQDEAPSNMLENTDLSMTLENEETEVESIPKQTVDHTSYPVAINMTNDVTNFERFFNEEQCVLSHLRYHRLLVHGNNNSTPIDSIAKANFDRRIHDVLSSLGIRMVYRLQAYAWPHIMRGNSLLCVNSPRTGKTLAYLPAVCSYVKVCFDEQLYFSGAGPIGIIVCHSSTEVERVAYLCRRMLNSQANRWLSVVECYGIRLVIQVCNKLFAGCALLVTTISAYRRLYEAMPEAFVRDRIQLVVIDNIELMLQNFAPDIRLLFKNCDKPDLQMIIMAAYWDQGLGYFVNYKDMMVCIGAYLEAAVYANVQIKLKLLRNDGKKQHDLVQHIRKHNYRTQRTIVFASTDDDIRSIVETLRINSIQHLVCNTSTAVVQHEGFRDWDDRLPGDMTVLVCLDEVFGDLCVTKVQHIVHYSLPDSWTRFTRRFATSFNYYKSPYQTQQGDTNPDARPSTLLLLDENNSQQLPKLINFLELHRVQFPKELSVLAQNIRHTRECMRFVDGRAVYRLCPTLLTMGVCNNVQTCRHRHTLMKVDLAVGQNCLPSSGMVVKLTIRYVFSPVHFAGRLEAYREEYANSSWTPVCDPQKCLLHDMRLQAYFASTERQQLYGKKVTLNDLCAVFHEKFYWRCRIIHFEPDDESPTVGEVELQFIDTGRILSTKSTNLLSLPAKFHDLPGQAIDVRIAGVVPHDFEDDWDQESTQYVQQLVEQHLQKPNGYMEAKVQLALHGMIWIDELSLVEQLPDTKMSVFAGKIKSSIIAKQFGLSDRVSFERLKQMVQDFQASSGSQVRQEENISPKPTTTPEQGTTESDSIPPSDPVVSEQSVKNDNRNELENVECLEDSVLATSQQKDVLAEDPIPNEALGWNPGRQTPLKGDHSKEKDNSISSHSSFEILSPVRDKEEYRFEAFNKGKLYHVIIGQYSTPDLFYVFEIDKMKEIHAKIATYTANESKMKQLTHIQAGVHCLLYFEDEYQRSKIMEVSENGMIKVSLQDFGGTTWCYRESLFEIPTHLLRDYPFAAVEAKLGLIEPMEGTTWTEEIGNAIYDEVLENYNERGMVAHVLKTLSPRNDGDTIEGCNRYELLLADPDATNVYSIVSELTLYKLAMVNYEQHQDASAFNDEDEEEDDAFVQLEFTHEELKAILGSIVKKQPDALAAVASAAVATDTVEQSKATASTNTPELRGPKQPRKSTGTCTKATPSMPRHKPSKPSATPLPRLECDYRFPPTFWWQDDFFITLYVSAPDVSHYQLTVDAQSLLLQYVRDDHRFLLPLNLFGLIDPKHTTHEVRGLLIVIRLARLPGSNWRWPMLINHTGKLPWLKKRIGPPSRHPRTTSSDGWSDSESPEVNEFEWSDLLPSKLNDMYDSNENNSQEEQNDDVELQAQAATEEEIFYGLN